MVMLGLFFRLEARPGKETNMAEVNFRGRIYDSIVDTIGATPLVRLQRLATAHKVRYTILRG